MPSRVATDTLDVLGQVRREALNAGATLKLCSQAVGLLKSHLDAQGQGGGICRSMSIEWIKAQGKGTSLIDTICGLGGSVNINNVAPMIRQYELHDFDNDKPGERAYIKSKIMSSGFVYGGVKSAYVNSVKGGIGSWYCNTNIMPRTCYLRLIAMRSGVPHAMAVDILEHKFFDPNLGEFTFSSDDDLVNFLNTSIFPYRNDKGAGEYVGRNSFLEVEQHGFFPN